MTSMGWVPILIEIGSGSSLANAFSAKRLRLLGGDDVDAGERLLLDEKTVDAGVQPVLAVGVAGQRDAGGDHRPAVEHREQRDRQPVEVDVRAFEQGLAGGAGIDRARLDGAVEAGAHLRLDPAEIAPHGDGEPVAVVDHARDHRHVVARHVGEQQRLVRLVDQRRDVADIDRAFDLDQLVRRAKIGQELAKILRHSSVPSCLRPDGITGARAMPTRPFDRGLSRLLDSGRFAWRGSAPAPSPHPGGRASVPPCRHGRRRPTIHEFFWRGGTTKKRGWSAFADHDAGKRFRSDRIRPDTSRNAGQTPTRQVIGISSLRYAAAPLLRMRGAVGGAILFPHPE